MKSEDVGGKLPAIFLYVADIERDCSMLSIEATGLWNKMLWKMHFSPHRGFLLKANGRPYSVRDLADLAKCKISKLKRVLAELEEEGIYSIVKEGDAFPVEFPPDSDQLPIEFLPSSCQVPAKNDSLYFQVGTIFCRRMVRENRIRKLNQANANKRWDGKKEEILHSKSHMRNGMRNGCDSLRDHSSSSSSSVSDAVSEEEKTRESSPPYPLSPNAEPGAPRPGAEAAAPDAEPESKPPGVALPESLMPEIVTERDIAFVRAASEIAARHPRQRSCSPAVVERLLRAACKVPDAVYQICLLPADIDLRHRGFCATGEWRKEGGRYAPQLAKWLDTEKGKWMFEPPEGDYSHLDKSTQSSIQVIEFLQRKHANGRNT